MGPHPWLLSLFLHIYLSPDKYLLTDYLVPNSVLDTRETVETKINVILVQEG